MRSDRRQPVTRSPRAGSGLSFWQRRYVLRHYRRYPTRVLAAGASASVQQVRAYLEAQRATPTAADERRMAKAGEREPPLMLTPGVAARRLTHLRSRPLDAWDAVLLAALFAGSLALYAFTAARTVTGEDAGELLAAAHGFGIPHPPGYPLWLVLGWSFDHGLPWGAVAWRVSLVSAVFSALANVCLLAVCLKTLRSRVVAWTGATLFAVSLTHWMQAVIPEVYGLNTFFVALTALLLLRLKERASPGRLFVLAAVVGLSCTNHPTAFPVAGVTAVAALLVAPQLLRRPFVVAGALVAGLAPLALYLVLPWASARDPYLDWGNPEGPSALWAHVTRAQYTSAETVRQASGSYEDYLTRLGILGRSAGQQFGSPWLLALGLVGFFGLLFRQTGVWLFWVTVGWLCSVGITRFTDYSFDREHVYANQIFFIPAWLAVSWLLAGGMDSLLAAARHAYQRMRHWGERPWGGRAVLPGVASLACFALPWLPAAANFDRADRSGTTLIADYGRTLLDTMQGSSTPLGWTGPSAPVVAVPALASSAPASFLASHNPEGSETPTPLSSRAPPPKGVEDPPTPSSSRAPPHTEGSKTPASFRAPPNPKGANAPLYFPASDHSTFAVLYWQGVEGYGTGVVVADKYGVIEAPVRAAIVGPEDEARLAALGGSRRRREFERLAIERWGGPVYFANRRDMSDLPEWVQEPVGPLFRIMRRDEAEAWWASEGDEESSTPEGLAIWDRFADLLEASRGELVDFTEQLVASELKYMHGFALARAGRLEEALAEWGGIDADLAPVKQLKNNIGSALAEHGRISEALVYYRAALTEDVDYVLALRNQARVYTGLGELERAVQALEAVLQVAPDLRVERLELARQLGKLDRVIEALAQYEGLARRDRSDPLPWREAGELLERVGDMRKAKQAFEESFRLDSSQVAVAQRLDRLRRGVPHLHASSPMDPAGWSPDPLAGLSGAVLGDPMSGLAFPAANTTPLPPNPRDALQPGVPQPPSPAETEPRRSSVGNRP